MWREREKRIAAFVLLAVILAAFVGACAAPPSAPAAETQASVRAQASETPENAPEETKEPASAPPEPDAEGTDVLVVYYSATGNTERVAKAIADSVHADLFALTPEAPYTEEDLDWRDPDSRYSKERKDPSLLPVALEETKVPEWEDYGTVFVGYPIWTGIAAFPMQTFVAANDFAGKTVIPFCTSGSSPIGESGQRLAQAAGTGTWLGGMRFRENPDEQEVSQWAQSVRGGA